LNPKIISPNNWETRTTHRLAAIAKKTGKVNINKPKRIIVRTREKKKKKIPGKKKIRALIPLKTSTEIIVANQIL